MSSQTLWARPADLPRVHRAVLRLWGETRSAGAGPDELEAAAFHTAVIELSTNVIRHAYAGNPDGLWTLTLNFDGNATVEAVLEDKGQPYFGHTPRTRVPFGPDCDALPEGGYGLALARAAVDEMEYLRLPDARNRWRVQKRLRGARDPSIPPAGA